MNWIENQIRQVSRNRLIAAVLALVAVALVLGYQARYIKNFINGPTATSEEQIAAITDVNSLENYWVTVQPTKVIYTGLKQITISKRNGMETGRKVSGIYYVAQIGERYMMVKAPAELNKDSTSSLTGALVPVTASIDSDYFDEINGMIKKRGNSVGLYPMMLDTKDFKSKATLPAIILALITLAALYFGFRAFGAYCNPKKHPALIKAASWSGNIDQEIELELAAPEVTKDKNFVLTRHYLIEQSYFTFNLEKLANVVWAYKVVTKKKWWGVIPAGKEVAAQIKTSDPRVSLRIGNASSEAKVDAALAHIAQFAPWAVSGYSKELETAFTKNFKEFVEKVKQKKGF